MLQEDIYDTYRPYLYNLSNVSYLTPLNSMPGDEEKDPVRSESRTSTRERILEAGMGGQLACGLAAVECLGLERT